MVPPTLVDKPPGAGASDYPLIMACKDAKYKATLYYDDTYDGAVAYDKTDKWLFAYDNVKALRTKLCTTGRYVARPKLNFAAIDVQFEDANNDCGSGAFARLHFLKALAKFFHGNYTPPAPLAACNRLA
ncbi:hypothetical protein V5799_032094 [Amblyomma americanum]|uniref:Uncharacterized protein n=1 Tax=Amblyomma americanum TaxID=6943 RepID=A0AAQ4DS56_AMBAM